MAGPASIALSAAQLFQTAKASQDTKRDQRKAKQEQQRAEAAQSMNPDAARLAAARTLEQRQGRQSTRLASRGSGLG